MVYNTFIKCQVCQHVTRVRLQVGLQTEHPIVIICGNCETSLSGTVKIEQDRPGLKFSFQNADEIPNAEADFAVECSGEFPTRKQGKAIEFEISLITPFIRYLTYMKTSDSFDQFAAAISQLNTTEKKWHSYKRILDLSKRKSKYLISEIHKEFPPECFECRDEFEILYAVHSVEIQGFYSALRKDIFHNSPINEEIIKLNPLQVKKLIHFLNSHEGYHLAELQELIYKTCDEFIKVYQRLIPALALQYCKEGSFNFEIEGSTTSTFDSVKQFYLNTYEALGAFAIIPIALNNIKYRGDVNSLDVQEVKASSLEDFIKLAKGSRYRFWSDAEFYTAFLDVSVNTKLRNAIGHNDFEYDIAKQLITYIPNSKDRSKRRTEYLLEFENEAMRMFQAVLGVSEYLYNLRKISLFLEGKIPEIVKIEQAGRLR